MAAIMSGFKYGSQINYHSSFLRVKWHADQKQMTRLLGLSDGIFLPYTVCCDCGANFCTKHTVCAKLGQVRLK